MLLKLPHDHKSKDFLEKFALMPDNIVPSRAEAKIDDLVQDCSISIANPLEILQSCTKPSKCSMITLPVLWLLMPWLLTLINWSLSFMRMDFNSLRPSGAYICVGNLTIIGSNAGILLIGPLGTNFIEMLIEIHTFSFKKIHLKMSSGKWGPFCLGLNVLTLKRVSHFFLNVILFFNVVRH